MKQYSIGDTIIYGDTLEKFFIDFIMEFSYPLNAETYYLLGKNGTTTSMVEKDKFNHCRMVLIEKRIKWIGYIR